MIDSWREMRKINYDDILFNCCAVLNNYWILNR